MFVAIEYMFALQIGYKKYVIFVPGDLFFPSPLEMDQHLFQNTAPFLFLSLFCSLPVSQRADVSARSAV